MKKYIYSSALLLAVTITHAQSVPATAADAVRYSLDGVTGTARFRAMSGAFGAVGGDVSSIGVNPAGAALYNYNSGTISLSNYNTSNSANYFGTQHRQNDNAFDMNQLGAVFVFNNSRENAVMNKFTLGFNYENTNSFENAIGATGINPTNSIANYFLNNANSTGISLGALQTANFESLNYAQQQALFGYNAYVIDPVSNTSSNKQYVAASNITGSNGYYQDSNIVTAGYNGKVALNFATQMFKRLYLGANLNVHFTDYINRTTYYEEVRGTQNTGFNALQFNNKRYTYGGGVSMNVGGIVKITEAFRAGVAYESPTWLRLQDEVTQSVDYTYNGANDYYDPGITMVGNDYTIKTPSKWTGSLAYVFGKHGLISADYAVRNYGNTRYSGGGTDFSAINNQLSSQLDWAGELRIGAEYRIKAFSLRGGYRYQESPYKNTAMMGNLTGYSGGFGFNFGGSRLDLAYTWFQRTAQVGLFNSPDFSAASVKTTNNNVVLSYTIDL